MIKSVLRHIAAKTIHLFPKGCVYFGHGVANEIKDPYVESLHMPKSDFISLLEFWKKAGVRFYNLEDIMVLSRNGFKSTKPWIHFTFDDGYQNNLATLLPIMEKYEIPFTVFATTGLINQRDRMPSYKIKVALLNAIGSFSLGKKKYSLGTSTDRNARIVMANQMISLYKKMPWDEVASLITSIEGLLDESMWNGLNLQFANDQLLTVDELKTLSRHDLVSIGTHGLNHMILHEQQNQVLVRKELLEPGLWLLNELNIDAKAFAYPNGQAGDYSKYSIEQTKSLNMDLAFTTEQGLMTNTADSYVLPRMFLEASVSEVLCKWLFCLLD